MGKTEEEWKVINRKLVRNYLDGYRAGQLAMRERAAKVADALGETYVGEYIRALEPEEPT